MTTVSLATITDLHASWDALLKAAPSVYVTRHPTISEVTGKQNLVIKLNGGTTEGTNMFTYAVTTAKTVNITPSSIGAAALSHTHTLSQISDLHANWDAILKAAPTAHITRWPSWSEVTNKPTWIGSTAPVYSWSDIEDKPTVFTTNIASISDLHSSWDAVLKAQKPAWLTSVSLATISDLNSSWDALLKAAPSAYVTRWPTAAEVGALTQTSADARYLLKSAYTAADVLAKIKTVDGSGSGLDADTLDGVHNGSVTANHIYLAGGISDFNTLMGNGIYSWGFNIANQPANYGAVLQFSNVNNPVPGTQNHWLTQLASSTNNRLYYRTRTNTGNWNSWRTIAFTSDNVASATRLQTARTINGTSFDGTANITTVKWGTARTLTLTGAVTGSVSIDGSGNISLATAYSTGSAGPLDGRYALKGGSNATGTWPISISGSSVRITSTIYNSGSLASLTTAGCLYHAAGSNTVTDKPSGVDAFGLFTMQTASAWQGQILMSSNTATGLYWRTANNNFNGGWRTILDSSNYTTYTVTKTGGGASGTWGISITGNAATATNADTLDGRQGTSYGIMWGGMNTDTDKEADDTTSTSITDFLTRLNYSGIFGSKFGAMRGSWYYVGNTQYNTGVGTLEMAGTAVLNMSAYANTSADYKTLLFLEGSTGNMYSYVSQKQGTARWSRYAKTTDNVASATKLATARQINGTNFDGTANITTAKWGTARNIYIRDASQAHTGTAVSVDGSANEYLLLPSTITATLNGNASTASKWATARTLTLTGDATGSASMDGSANVSMSVNVADSDKLDGYHETSFFRSNISTLANETITNIPANRSGSYTLTHSGWNGSAFVFYAYSSNSTMAFMIKGGQSANVNLLTTTDSAASKWTDRGVLLTTSNYTSTLDSRYVNVSGDTMTGKLTWSMNGVTSSISPENVSYFHYRTTAQVGHWFDKSVRVQGEIYAGSGYDQKVWHAGNDGSGSGLDADLLDGTHKTGLLTSVASSSTTNLSVAVGGTTKSVADLYATYLDGVTLAGLRGLGYAMQVTTIDASSLDEDIWYPVTINLGQRDSVFIALIVSLDSGTKPSWSTHNSGFSVRKVWYSNGSGWGTN